MVAALSMLLVRRSITARATLAAATTLDSKSWRVFYSNVASADNGTGTHSSNKVDKLSDNGHKNFMTNKPAVYDVAIVGGGMVGLAFACALSSLPLTKQLTVAIIDPSPALQSTSYLSKSDVPDSRVSTVTPATISFFKDIGAWEHVQKQRHAFFDRMQVWDYTGLGYTRFSANDVEKDYLGCVVENKVLCNSLILTLQDKEDFQKTIVSANLTKLAFQSKDPSSGIYNDHTSSKAKLAERGFADTSSELTHLNHLAKLELSDGQHIYTKLVVGADGSKSRVREIAGIQTTGWNYAQTGLICTVEHNVENYCAWQRFLPSGPIALLPIGEKFSNIVWTMNSDESTRHKMMSEEDFVRAVNHALDLGYGPHPQSNTLDNYVSKLPLLTGQTPSTRENFEVPPRVTNVISERMAFPLSLRHAHDYSLKRIVLIGDAAHAVHPLAGQGVNLGFGDASTLARVIAEGLAVGADIAEPTFLKKYEKERKAANIPMMAMLDGFQKAYSVDLGPINILRAAAFHGAQFIGPLKKNIISYAMGEQKLPFFL